MKLRIVHMLAVLACLLCTVSAARKAQQLSCMLHQAAVRGALTLQDKLDVMLAQLQRKHAGVTVG